MPHLRASLGKVWTLLFSVCIFVLGHGLQGTLLSVRAGKEEMSDQIVGLMVSAYFLGYLASSLVSPRWCGRPVISEPLLRSLRLPRPSR